LSRSPASAKRPTDSTASSGGKPFITADDVAALAGVSRSAVSRTFTPGASVSKKTRLRVEQAAEALGYRVNRIARSLSASRSNLVGVLGASIGTPFMARQLDLLSRALLRRGLQCLLLNATGAEDDLDRLIGLILEFRVRAIVVMSGAPPQEIIDQCLANGVRVVLINRRGDANSDSVIGDDRGGGRLAARRLIAAGCRRIAVVGSAVRTLNQLRRRESFVRTIRLKGQDVIEWTDGQSDYETGQLAGQTLIERHRVDGMFCVTDLLAIGVLDAARAHGARVPRDLSVIGFDDIPQAEWDAYRLTTFRLPLERLVAVIVAAIERDAADGERAAHYVLPMTLVERRTVRSSATARD
jgi:DNA-binding LacI/PurR family transcriptional regulator